LFTIVNSTGSVAIPNNFTLTRQSSSGINYTAYIPQNTIVSGGVSWDGQITLPIVNASSFTVTDGGTSPVVVDMGSSVELNFSKPVKVFIGGVGSGKKAAWSRGSSSLTPITTQCDNATNYSKIDSVTTRDCYYNEGSDMIIWTYHFTSFAAYTPSTTTTPDTGNVGGGLYGCPSDWTCSSWSSCASGMQARTCTKNNPLCAQTYTKPSESQSCTVPTIPTGNETIPTTTPPTTTPTTTPTEEAKKGLTIPVAIFIAAVVLIIIVLALTQLAKKKKK